MRIINIVENLDLGAVENWLVRTFVESRKVRPEWDWTFYCILGREGRLDQKVRDAGAKIIYAPVTVSDKIAFLKHLRATLVHGRYDIIHSHHDYLCGFYLLASLGLRFKKRILHIHNTDKSLPVGNKFLHRILLRPLRTIAIYFSDIIVGISNDTLLEFVGRNANAKRKGRILYYGIDLRPFEIVSDKELFRKQLGMPGSAKILLFIGRLNSFKNPLFVVVILHELLKSRNDVYAVFVGKGDLEGDIFSMAVELGIIEHIRILGWSDSTSQIMKDSDVFVFPRVEYPKEGLGLVIVEAQAAGLSMIISNGIVEDAIVIKELVYYSSLNDPPSFWARNIEEILANKPAVSQIQALELMKSSRFDLREATQNFIDLYE